MTNERQTYTEKVFRCLTVAIVGAGIGLTACGDADSAGDDPAVAHTVTNGPDAALDASMQDADAASPPAGGDLPPAEDPWDTGPFSTVTISDAGPDGNHTLVRPETLADSGKRHPLIVFGNGGGTRPPFYDRTFTHLASHGFVVIASNEAVVTGAMLTEGLAWVLDENGDADSDLYEAIDTDNIGAMGYSLGSLAIYEILNDGEQRLKTTVHAAGGIMNDAMRERVLKEPGPTAYLCDGMDTKTNCDGDYDAVQVPVFYGTLIGAEHITVFLPPYVDRVNGAATAWMRWYLMDDEDQESVFLGDDCQLCDDPNWVAQSKNW